MNQEISKTIESLFNIEVSRRIFFGAILIPIQLLMIPCMFGHSNGYSKATNTTSGLYIKNSISCTTTEFQKYIYITTLGERAITISSKDSSICITDEKSFTLQPFEDPI